MSAPVTFPTNVIAPITPELKPVIGRVIIFKFNFYLLQISLLHTQQFQSVV